jgi:hypothetical protein
LMQCSVHFVFSWTWHQPLRGLNWDGSCHTQGEHTRDSVQGWIWNYQ